VAHLPPPVEVGDVLELGHVSKILWTSREAKTMSEEEEEEEDPLETLERILAEDENYQALLRLIERAKIELETGKRPPPDSSHA
jgi:hypothetical protein